MATSSSAAMNTQQEEDEAPLCCCALAWSSFLGAVTWPWFTQLGGGENKSSVVIQELPCQMLVQSVLKVHEPLGEMLEQPCIPLGPGLPTHSRGDLRQLLLLPGLSCAGGWALGEPEPCAGGML